MTEAISALLGAVVGGFFAIWAAKWQFELQRRRRRANLEIALAVEVATLVELVRKNAYVEGLFRHADYLRVHAPKHGYPPFVIHATQGYFTVFEANAADVGELDPALAVDVVAFYQQARSLLDSLSNHAPLDTTITPAAEAAGHYEMLAKAIEKLTQLGEDLFQRLAPVGLSKRILLTAKRLDPNTLGITQRIFDSRDDSETAIAAQLLDSSEGTK